MEFDPSKLAQMMGQAQAMQQKLQDDLTKKTTEGQAGGGMVKVTLNGGFECVGLTIEKSVVDKDDVTMLEDLVRAAINDAVRRVEEMRMSEVRGVMGGMGLPDGLF